MLRRAVVRSFLTGLGVALIATACTPENISAPVALASPAGSILGPSAAKAPPKDPKGMASADTGSFQQAIQRKHALKSDITVTQVIGVKGGTLRIPQAGLTIEFAPGALTMNTPITATALAGSLVAYEFGPHGTQFQAPVTITQDMKQTTIDKKASQADSLFGGYMPQGAADINGDSVHVSEMHKSDTKVGKDFFGGKVLKSTSFVVPHFSGYILISGRSGASFR